MKKILLFLFVVAALFGADKKAVTTKQVCAVISDYPGKTVAQFKKILLNKAKQEALTELYGQLLYTKEDLKNGKLVSEEVRNRAIGAVRIEGTPNFFNGKGFGELCAKITAYATKKDLQMYSPKKVILKHFCYTNPDVPIKQIKEEAKYAAFKELASQYDPKIKSGKVAANCIHQFKLSNPTFDFEKMSYCFDATATILPYECALTTETSDTSNTNTQKASLDKTIYGKWYGSYYWRDAKDFLMMKIIIKKDNTFKAFWERGDFIKDAYYTGTVMKTGNKVILLPDQKAPFNGPKGWTTDTLKLNFDPNNLTLTGKIMNYSNKSGAKFVKVAKFPEEYAIKNPNNDLNGKWYGWYDCGKGDYYYLKMTINNLQAEMVINNGSHILKKSVPTIYTVFQAKNKVFFDGGKRKTPYTELGKYYADGWTNDNLKGIINGNIIKGESICSNSNGKLYMIKVSKFIRDF